MCWMPQKSFASVVPLPNNYPSINVTDISFFDNSQKGPETLSLKIHRQVLGSTARYNEYDQKCQSFSTVVS